MPYISVIIPAYNAAQTLPETLESIIVQSFTDWQVFVIDDGSSDATHDIVAHYAARDRRISLVQNPGKGPSDARNHGALSCANGEILSFCDADDIWTADKLRDVAEAMADQNIDAVFGQVAFFITTPNDGRSLSTVPVAPLNIADLLGENPICTTSNLSVRRECFVQTGGFDPTLKHSEDLEWLIRLVGEGGRLIGINRPHVYYRTVVGGLSTDLKAMAAGHARALQTAASYGVTQHLGAEARHLRYLSRRALRLDAGAITALRLALKGLLKNPYAFLSPPQRGLATLIAALIAPFLPRAVRRALFSR